MRFLDDPHKSLRVTALGIAEHQTTAIGETDKACESGKARCCHGYPDDRRRIL